MYYRKYEGDKIYLSPICVDDYQVYTKWLNDESLASGLGNFYSNINENNEKEWLESSNKKGEYNFSVIRKEDNKLIGNYSLHLRNEPSRRFHVGGFIGEEEDRGKGYGTEALKLITKFAFEVLNAQSVFSGVYEFNVGSIKSAEKAGYTKVGRYRNAYYYNSEFYDEICVDIIRSDYEKQKNKT